MVSATHVLIVAESSPLKNVPQLPPTGEAEDVERVRPLRKRGRSDLFQSQIRIAVVLNDQLDEVLGRSHDWLRGQQTDTAYERIEGHDIVQIIELMDHRIRVET